MGAIDSRAKVPWGKGLWPALWLLPQDEHYGAWAASGEIDVMEIVGDQPQQVLSSLHFGSRFPARTLVTHARALPDGSSVADGHVYSVEWTPGEICWRVDGVSIATRTFWWNYILTDNGAGVEARSKADIKPWPAPFDQPVYLVINMAVDGNFPGLPDADTHFPAELVLDYVRVGGCPELHPRGKGRLPWQKKSGEKDNAA